MAGSASAWGSVVLGLASVATLPAAVYASRFSETYELIDAAYAIPVVAVLAVLALWLSRRARRLASVRLGRESALGRTGRLLAVVGLCIASSAVVSLIVYGLLDYAGSRE